MLDQAIFNHPVGESGGACAKLLHHGVCIHGGKRREKLRHLSRDLVALAFCSFGWGNRSAHGTDLQQRNDKTGDIFVRPLSAHQAAVSSSGRCQRYLPPAWGARIDRSTMSFASTMAGNMSCLLYTSDAADDLLCVDLGGRRIIKKKKI